MIRVLLGIAWQRQIVEHDRGGRESQQGLSECIPHLEHQLVFINMTEGRLLVPIREAQGWRSQTELSRGHLLKSLLTRPWRQRGQLGLIEAAQHAGILGQLCIKQLIDLLTGIEVAPGGSCPEHDDHPPDKAAPQKTAYRLHADSPSR